MLNATELAFTKTEKDFLNSIETIRLCTGPDTMPLDDIRNGKHVGINAEFMAIFQQSIGKPIELIQTKDWPDSISRIKSDQCDILSLAQKTPSREAFLKFSNTYVSIPFVVVTTQEKFFVSHLSEIIDKRLGIRKGYAYVELLRDRYPGVIIEEVESIEKGLDLVNKGELFGYLSGLQIAGYAIQNGGHSNLKISGKFDELSRIELGIGVNKNHQELVGIFNKAIKDIDQNTIKQINNSWLTIKYQIAEDYTRLSQFAVVVAVLLGFLLYRQFSLRRHNEHLRKSERAIWRQANFDLLTQLPNRQLFLTRIEEQIVNALERRIPFSLMLIDLDGFKQVNDTLGHEQGDHLLRQAAERIANCLTEKDTLARLGGDEFIVIHSYSKDENNNEQIAEAILQALKAPFNLKEDVYISASIGLTACPRDSTTRSELLKNVDHALFAAKEKGRNAYHHYSIDMRLAAVARMRLIQDMRQAIDNQEFEVFYQPIIDLQNNRVRKCEALIRWNHPERGYVSPFHFIPILEETRMIIDVGEWVFEQSALQAKDWRKRFDKEFQISVNTSAVQFQSRSTRNWQRKLNNLGVEVDAVGIEITESMLMEGFTDITAHLNDLRVGGFQISLDDFGTGYSSLSYLKKFDIDYLKIDKSFVNNLSEGSNDMVLCEAIIVMAHKLGLKVIAEGVETEDQQHLLTDAGCDFGQGYLFAKPLPPASFEEAMFGPKGQDI
jgi:diguanylate cyclase (GGDEF)-like protein